MSGMIIIWDRTPDVTFNPAGDPEDLVVWDVAGWVFRDAVEDLVPDLREHRPELAELLQKGADNNVHYVNLAKHRVEDILAVYEAALRVREKIVARAQSLNAPGDQAYLARFEDLIARLKAGIDRRA